MHEYVGMLIAAARRRIKQSVLARAAEHGLTVQQFWFLVALRERPGISQAELAERVRADAPTVSRVVTALTRRRLVRAEPDPRDRRRASLRLTPAGERLGDLATATAREIREAIVAGMSEAELDALRGGLRRVIDNVERWERGEAATQAARGVRRGSGGRT
jgi:DNA-binding MarR family transcriptional regulator